MKWRYKGLMCSRRRMDSDGSETRISAAGLERRADEPHRRAGQTSRAVKVSLQTFVLQTVSRFCDRTKMKKTFGQIEPRLNSG